MRMLVRSVSGDDRLRIDDHDADRLRAVASDGICDAGESPKSGEPGFSRLISRTDFDQICFEIRSRPSVRQEYRDGRIAESGCQAWNAPMTFRPP